MRANLCIVAAILGATAGFASGQACPPRWWSAGPGLGDGGVARAMLAADVEGASRLYIGGEFHSAGGVPARNIAAWDGATWSQPATGLSGPVVSMTVHPHGGGPRLFIGGFFDEGRAAGPGPDGLVWLDGDAWGGVPPGSPLFWTMGLCSFGGDLFASAGVSDYVWRLGPAGWSVPGGGLESVIHAGLAHDDGSGPSLFAAGSMVEAIRRWYGVAWRGVGGGLNGAGYALAVYDDGRGPALYVGGTFTRAGGFGGPLAANIARWDGARWEALGPGTGGVVNALAVFDDGSGAKLYAGGRFAEPGRNLAAWDGAAWRPVEGGVAGEVHALAVFDADGPGGAAARLAVGGAITEAGGAAVDGLVFYGPCRADFTCDGLADFVDFLEFLNAYDAGEPGADLTGDGLVDFADYLDFLNAYAAGC